MQYILQLLQLGLKSVVWSDAERSGLQIHTQVVLDVTELHCQTSNSLLLQSKVVSTYTSQCTFKGLLVCPFMGQYPLCHLFLQANKFAIVSLLKAIMAIMVDIGFLVEDSMPYKVYIPAFLSMRAQLSVREVSETVFHRFSTK